ncbi:M50 family metallopeptidase [Geotalea sp. SG265]|uniref:M50 family metallopeptidase n=1 Tax=Geotalea sp. SG265 TaxID=2922867 RepID=UPI001FAFFEF5|nr:M50 family metallopeptidase [Geotalea sp. SG265]
MFANDPKTAHFAGLLLAIFLAAAQERVGRAGAFWLILFALPGTILHETSHYLVALLTGGRPRGFSIIPHRQGGTLGEGSSHRRWVLGSVAVGRAGMVSAVPTALAPLWLIVAAWYLYRRWFAWFPADTLHTLLLYAVVYLFCYSAVPSRADLQVALSSPASLLLYGCLAALLFCTAGLWA